MHKGFIVEDIKRTKVAMDIFSVRLPVSELWRENHFRVAENAIRKHDTGFMHKSFIVEDIKRTKVAMDIFFCTTSGFRVMARKPLPGC